MTLKRLVWMLLTILPPLVTNSPVHVAPDDPVISTTRGHYVFRCLTYENMLQSVTWLLNGTELESLGLDNVNPSFVFGIGSLRFTNLDLEYNHTTIQCRGQLQSGRNITSESVVLLMQGTLAAVGDLSISSQNSSITLNWTAPFTLDISEEPVDITYTVGVVSPASSLTVHMEIGVNMTEFSYPLPPDIGCDNLMFTVIPVNGAGDGISNSISLSQAVESPQLMEGSSPPKLAPTIGTGGVIVYHVSVSSPVCSAEITLTDKDTGEVITLGEMDLNISSPLMDITFTNERMAKDRLYRVMVNASNINGSAIFISDISTYDVVKSGIYTSPVRVHTEYLPNSNAAGVLYGFLYIGESGIDFSRSFYFPLSRNDSLSYELPSPLPAGVYYVHTYVIGKGGLLSSGELTPVTTEVFSGSGGSQTSISPSSFSEIGDCDILISGLVVSVLCSHSPTSSSTGFMLVVQEKSVNGARRLLVNSTEQVEPQGPVTVEVAGGGAYQVTVFPIREGMGVLDSNVAYSEEIAVGVANNPTSGTTTQRRSTATAPPAVTPVSEIIGVGTGLGVLALLAVILGAVILVVVCHRSKGSIRLNTTPELNPEENTDANMEPSGKVEPVGIYEEIGDAKSSFTYTQNILYGHSTTGVTHNHRLTSHRVPEVSTVVKPSESYDQESQMIDVVKNSFRYTRNVPEVCGEEASGDYILMQTAEVQSFDDAFKVQNCSAYGIALSGDKEEKSHNYEQIQTIDAYKVQQCPAYGVTSSSCDPIGSRDPSSLHPGPEENCCAKITSEASSGLDDPNRAENRIASSSEKLYY